MLITIFYQFFLLGWTSFGGPAAHLGYFQRHFVSHLGWLSAERYAHLISLSQILPGPGSSQVGFAIGMEKAGWLGGLAAFIGFTLPSFLIMVLLAFATNTLGQQTMGIVAGLKLFAVVIVADAIISMARSFCKTLTARLIAAFAAIAFMLLPSFAGQLLILIAVTTFGAVVPQTSLPNDSQKAPLSTLPWQPLALFIGLFVLSLTLWQDSLFGQIYQAGALVFGGGHVVLPLLQASVPTLPDSEFLTAYAAAQAVPGPMFTIASYLGALAEGTPSLGGAFLATIAIFLPGLLLMGSFIGHWQALLTRPRFASISVCLNAAVVGLLTAAWLDPIIPAAISSYWHWLVVLLGYMVLVRFKPPIWTLLLAFAIVGLMS
ncbi:chromate efflux transporter [Pseudoalteromonas fenneropenaei]|uniref:Chromate efflux transporter n=1 Tax=Pseudoalteromonas fenneropenaei TaxID=1737459 RepID=A0ABV7CPI2_9GAMM